MSLGRRRHFIVHLKQLPGSLGDESWAQWVEGLPEQTLAEQVGQPGGGSKTRFEMILGTKEHELQHRAQLTVIERLLGIVPHLTRNRQAVRTAATDRAS